MKKSTTFIILGIVLVLIIGLIGFKMTEKTEKVKILIETSEGNITLELNPQKAPITVENFLKYANSGYYTDTIFHRIIENFMIQGGGFNLEGIQKPVNAPIKLESGNGLSNMRGTIAMARTSIPNSATSQFFINTRDNEFLNKATGVDGYAVFGEVTEGMDVVDKIAAVETDSSDKPLENVVIKSVKVI